MSDQLDPSAFVVVTVEMIYSNAAIEDLLPRASFPMTVMSPSMEFNIDGPDNLGQVVRVLRAGFAEAGIAGVRCEVRTVLQPNKTLAIVSTKNARLGIRGEDMGEHRSTYVVRLGADGWRLVALSVDDEKNQSAVRERIETLMEREGILTRRDGSDQEQS